MNTDVFRLAKVLMRKELESRYRGSMLGLAWMLVLPIVMATLYTAVFWGVFQARWSGTASAGNAPVGVAGAAGLESGLGFGAQLFAGLVVFNFFTDLMVRSSRLIAENATLVKRIRFPLMSLVLSMLMSGLVAFAIGMAVSLVAAFLAVGQWHGNVLAMLLVIVQMLVLGFGIALWISAVSVYLRDLSQIMGAMVAGLLFISPVFYSKQAAPGVLQILLGLNPLSFSIDGLRSAIFYGLMPSVGSIAIAGLVAALVAASGLWIFGRLKPGFADLV